MQGGAVRPVIKPRGKAGAAPPDPTKQQDRHTALGGLLLRAEAAPDPLERLLAVCRVVLAVATDLARPGRAFPDTPVVVLGHHQLSSRALAEKYRGDTMQLFLQELCSHEPLAPTLHAKYAPPPPAGATPLPPAAAATLALRLRPAPAARCQGGGGGAGGLLDRLALGGGRGAAPEGAPPAWVEVSWEGGLTITLPRHAETYACTLPALVLAAPLAQACPLDFCAAASVACEATGLSAALRFTPFSGGAVAGSVGRLLGEGLQQVAALSGSWQGAVRVESREGAGVLFDAAQLPLTPAINLAEPGPRAATRLWAAILEELTLIDAAAAAKEGRRAGELAAALPQHLRRALMYEVESIGLPKPRAGADDGAAPGAAAAPTGETGGQAGAGLLPPCVLADRAKHGPLTYQLHYRLQPTAP